MARAPKPGPLPSRTMVPWTKGAFEPLQKDLSRLLRKGRGMRLKHLATLGLAAEAQGYSVIVDGGRLVLRCVDGQLLRGSEASTVPSPEAAPVPVEVAPADASPQVSEFMAQFMDHDEPVAADA